MSTLDLGLVGNSRTSALIDRAASIVWWCYPYFDDDPICCSLLQSDRQHGGFGEIGIGLEGGSAREQRYERNSAILVTGFSDGAGNAIEVIDFAPRFYMHDRLFAPAMLVRIVRRVSGRPRVVLRVRPAVGYGSAPSDMRCGANHVSYTGATQAMRLTTDVSVTDVTEERPFFLHDCITMLFGPDETVNGAVHEVGRAFYEKTRNYWHRWARNLDIPFEWQQEVIRAAITLKLNAFDDTGAITAAVTTSIPEAPHSGRNWDYRYCWLRDAFFVVNALNRLGATGTMEKYLDYILNVIADAQPAPLQPVYGIRRQATLEESVASSLDGYRGMGPVRVGNQAYFQVQNDVFGSAVLAGTQAFFDTRLERPAGIETFRNLERLGDRAVELYNVPDAGIWELRRSQRIHTYSSMMCWAACHRLGVIAEHLGLADRAACWNGHASRMHAEICKAAWNEKLSSFVSTFHGDRLDASLLLMAEFRFLEADDPRFVATVHAIERHLRRGDFLLRYDEEDDFGRPESAFLVCTFWWILALAQIGERDRARALFANVLGKCNHLGLLAEDVAIDSGELWGNFPQTYSMVGLIQCAARLSTPWEKAY
ncbi:MAG TPA: glycoside hydrolase family 15 protein [Noviherbaspirillum sp.]|jgi:GH15 family glucan-1,4-alpha-glucosidase|uniref:glycoside hydrolase family 15 protein n=1 Tax=Noviherbaspirillum sp. TaxID=1926288 RepID=UPI002F929520